MQTSRLIATAMLLGSLAMANPPVPRTAGELRINEPSGNTLTLSSQKGSVVLIQFLHTTCPHCQATARMLSKLQTDLGPKGLRVIGVAFNEEALAKPELMRTFVSSNGVTFPVGSAPPQTVMAYLGIPVIRSFVVPLMMVVDRKGVIRAQSEPMGTKDLQNETYLRTFLGDLLKESPTASRK